MGEAFSGVWDWDCAHCGIWAVGWCWDLAAGDFTPSPLAPALLSPAFPMPECLPSRDWALSPLHRGGSTARFLWADEHFILSPVFFWHRLASSGSFAAGWLQDYGTCGINPGIPNYADGVSSLKLLRAKEKQSNKFHVPNLNSLIKSMQSFDKSQC